MPQVTLNGLISLCRWWHYHTANHGIWKIALTFWPQIWLLRGA